MKRKIILGRYMEGDSWVHRLDPRAKMAAMPLFMVAVFMVDGYMGALALLLFTRGDPRYRNSVPLLHTSHEAAYVPDVVHSGISSFV